MGFFNKKNIEKQVFSQEQQDEMKNRTMECSKEIKVICEKYNCELKIKQEIVIIAK